MASFDVLTTGTTHSVANSHRGSGLVLIAEVDPATGLPVDLGFREFGMTSTITVQPEPEIEERTNYTSCAGESEELVTKNNLTVVLTTDTISAQNIAIALSGGVSTYNSDQGTAVTDVIITENHAAGFWYQLHDEAGLPLHDFESTATITLKKDADGTFPTASITLTEGTDYIFDRGMGMVRMLTEDPAAPYLAFDFSADTDRPLVSISALTAGLKDFAIRIKGINRIDCNEIIVDIFSVRLRSEEPISFIGDDRMELTLTGRARANTLAQAHYGSDSEFMHIRPIAPTA